MLFLIFNRPHTTRKVFEAIRSARPQRLYVAADGPRASDARDPSLCAAAREIALAVDWPCDVRTRLSDRNLGCGVAVPSAIDWFFEQEREGLILEDDCVPAPGFFPFAAQMLERYREDERVMLISGGCQLPPELRTTSSYSFSARVDLWGWATWRRAWLRNDRVLSGWRDVRKTPWLSAIGGGHADFARFWTQVFDSVARQPALYWDHQWVYSVWRQGGLSVVPHRNLVKNIGFGPDATRTKDDGGAAVSVPLEDICFPLAHPIGRATDVHADRWLDLHVYQVAGLPWWRRVRRKLARVRGRLLGPRPANSAP